MQLEYQLTVKNNKQVIARLLDFLSQEAILSLLLVNSTVSKLAANSTVVVNVVGKARMRTLNSQFRKKDASTDVLSFELHEQGVMGEIYLSPDDIEANAKMMKHPFANEFIEIFVHGILHLAGYDHEPEMFEWQKSITERILEKYETTSRSR